MNISAVTGQPVSALQINMSLAVICKNAGIDATEIIEYYE